MLDSNYQGRHHNASQDVEDWILTLIIAGIIFAFYVVFILQSGLEDPNPLIIYGGAVTFIAVEAYWILDGRKRHSKGTIAMGAIGIALALTILHFYHAL